ncbi:uncharacterized protein LTR77_005544 [Saxophila tyrrhenica]|uniref:Uncharacterized protein n=1 Tax=Saxophila tyrrhenica TaxID=1690608 RepID=A0AAV9P8X4_9PEZI|nr:hypothetical protein LTR77_005544 [Saxophila tyrrhenica]
MPPIQRLNLLPLDPVTHSHRAAQMTIERDAMIDKCFNWRRSYRREQHWNTPGRNKRLENLDRELDPLLMEADILAATISQHCGYPFAVEMADQVRQYLAKDSDDARYYLTLWRKPQGSQPQQLRQLMEIRVLMSMAMVVRNLCAKNQLDIHVGRKHAIRLINRLCWCPLVHKHWNRIQHEFGEDSEWMKHTVYRRAEHDATSFEDMLVTEYSSGSWWNGGIDWSTANSRKNHIKIHVLESLSRRLLLGSVNRSATKKLGDKRDEWLIPDPKMALSDAVTALGRFRLDFPDIDLDPNITDPDMIAISMEEVPVMARRWGFRSVNELAEPSVMADFV